MISFTDLSMDEANLIGEALRKFPYELVVVLINKLQKQIDEQLKPQLVKHDNAA
jgi:hypothetical protein